MRHHAVSLFGYGELELSVVEDYLPRGKYPDGFSKAEKANLRRKCRNNFMMDKGVLHYKAAIPEVWKCGY